LQILRPIGSRHSKIGKSIKLLPPIGSKKSIVQTQADYIVGRRLSALTGGIIKISISKSGEPLKYSKTSFSPFVCIYLFIT